MGNSEPVILHVGWNRFLLPMAGMVVIGRPKFRGSALGLCSLQQQAWRLWRSEWDTILFRPLGSHPLVQDLEHGRGFRP